jgi:hypothetical protein
MLLIVLLFLSILLPAHPATYPASPAAYPAYPATYSDHLATDPVPPSA